MDWEMLDGRHVGGMLRQPDIALLAIEWTRTLTEGEKPTFRFYLAKRRQLSNWEVPEACDVTATEIGRSARIDIVSHPGNDLLASKEYCIKASKSDFDYVEIQLDSLSDPGDYEFRTMFLEPVDGGYLFDDSYATLPSEVRLDVTVEADHSPRGCSSDSDCLPSEVCEGGVCVPDIGNGGGDDNGGNGPGDGENPIAGMSREKKMMLVGTVGGAAYFYADEKGWL